MEEKTSKFIKRKDLVAREGWSVGAIKHFLGEPDKLMEAKGEEGKQSQRFLLSKVEEVEKNGRLAKFNEKRAENRADKSQGKA